MLPFFRRKTDYKYALDTAPSAEMAYSLRKLRGDYTGDCIRIRRSTDDAESDIGFTEQSDGSYFLDTSTISTFIGAGTAYVTTFYDQSGNGRDLTQATSSLQPYIDLTGKNGRAAMRFSGAEYLGLASVTLSNFTVSIVFSEERTSFPYTTSSILFSHAQATSGGLKAVTGVGGDTEPSLNLFGTPITGGSQEVYFNGQQGSIKRVFKEQHLANVIFSAIMSSTTGAIGFGARSDGLAKADAYINELVVWSTYTAAPDGLTAHIANNTMDYWVPLPLDRLPNAEAAFGLQSLGVSTQVTA